MRAMVLALAVIAAAVPSYAQGPSCDTEYAYVQRRRRA
jgi:hypothetical protein